MTIITGFLTVLLMLPFTVASGGEATSAADSYRLKATHSTFSTGFGMSFTGLELHEPDVAERRALLVEHPSIRPQLGAGLHPEFLHHQIARRHFNTNDPDHLVFVRGPHAHPNPFLNTISGTPGYGFLASLLIPGLGQAANRQYWKTGLMLAVEAAAITLFINASNRGNRLENRYQRIGDENWSVVKYTAWVHNYYHTIPGARAPGAPNIPASQLLTPEGLANVNPITGFPDAVFDTSREWRWINREQLNRLERSSRYLRTGNFFTHEVNPFGSQQYYELMSKYWQFGPGWRDWNDEIHDINTSNEFMSAMWLEHARLEVRFNDAYRLANNMVSLVVMNHILSAFDAFFTIKLRQHRLEAVARADYFGTHMKLTLRF
jgi:hypothetical protein